MEHIALVNNVAALVHIMAVWHNGISNMSNNNSTRVKNHEVGRLKQFLNRDATPFVAFFFILILLVKYWYVVLLLVVAIVTWIFQSLTPTEYTLFFIKTNPQIILFEATKP